MKKTPKKYLLLLTAFLFLLRLLYHQSQPRLILTPDTYGYYGLGQKLFQENFSSFFNEFRTPLYPLFLGLMMKIQGLLEAPISSPQFFQGIRWVVFLQHLFGIFSSLFFFLLLDLLKIKRSFTFPFVLFLSLNPLVFAWEKVLLPETFSLFFLLLSTFLFLKAFTQPRFSYFFLLLLVFLLAFLLKPIYLFFPFFFLPIVLFSFPRRPVFLYFFFVLLTFLALPIFYLAQNLKNSQYRGINRVSDINLLGKILKYHLPTEEGKGIGDLAEKIKIYQEKGGDPHPYRFLENYDWSIYEKKEILNLLPFFNFQVIKAHWLEFILQSLKEMPKAFLAVSEFLPFSASSLSFSGKFFWFFFLLFHFLQLLFFPALFLFFFCFFLFLKNPNFQNSTLLILGIPFFFQTFFSLFFSYGEFGRLLTPAQPFVFLFLFSFFYFLFTNNIVCISGKKKRSF